MTNILPLQSQINYRWVNSKYQFFFLTLFLFFTKEQFNKNRFNVFLVKTDSVSSKTFPSTIVSSKNKINFIVQLFNSLLLTNPFNTFHKLHTYIHHIPFLMVWKIEYKFHFFFFCKETSTHEPYHNTKPSIFFLMF